MESPDESFLFKSFFRFPIVMSAMLLLVPIFALFPLSIVDCEQDSDCQKLNHMSTYGKMHTVALSGFEAISRLVATPPYGKRDVKKDLIKYFEFYLNRRARENPTKKCCIFILKLQLCFPL